MCEGYGITSFFCGSEGGKHMIHTRLEEMNLLDKFLFDEAMEDREKNVYYTEMQQRNTWKLEKRSRLKGTNKEDFTQEFLDFMEYIGKTTDENAAASGSERIKKIHKTVKRVRKSEKAGVRVMQRWEELAYAKEDGRAEGIAQGIVEMGVECGLPEEKILEKLQIKLHITLEKAEEYLSACTE